MKYLRLAAILAIAFMTLPVATADALCIQPSEEGTWKNMDPDTRGLTTVELEFICQDQVINGELYPPGPPWYIHVWGACSPTDCDWGRIGAENLGNTGFIYTVYEQGFATKQVWAKMSQSYPGKLWVHVAVDYTDPNRTDRTANYWFNKQ